MDPHRSHRIGELHVIAEKGTRSEFARKCHDFISADVVPPYERHNSRLCKENFVDVLDGALVAELCTDKFELRRYDIDRVDVFPAVGIRCGYRFHVEGLLEKRPSVITGDFVRVSDPDSGVVIESGARVVAVEESNVVIRTFAPNMPSKIAVRFLANVNESKKQRNALRYCFDQGLFLDEAFCLNTNMPDKRRRERETERGKLTEIVTDHRGAPLNPHQQDFINVSLHHVDCPRVCVLWGPPGTGKSTTLAAMVRTLRDRRLSDGEGCRVLICTPSNFAADHITDLLARSYDRENTGTTGLVGKLLRANAKSRLKRDVPPIVFKYSLESIVDRPSHLRDDGTKFDFRLPTIEEFTDADIIVCTLSTAATVFDRTLQRDPVRLDYVIVDEAAQCTEAQLLCAMQHVGASTRVILAGDHKQLGPVAMSDDLKQRIKFTMSPMERLMQVQRIHDTATVLLDVCYRCHPRILDLVNLFYEENRPLIPPKGGSFVEWTPEVHFHRFQMLDVRGIESRDKSSPSLGNTQEVDEVAKLLESLGKNKQVPTEFLVHAVVLTPYIRQVHLIRSQLRCDQRIDTIPDVARRNAVRNVEVATVEAFQGREASIVILSVVRSGTVTQEELQVERTQNIGFAGSAQRVNVGISRAINHVFIIGNLQFLYRDPVWRRVLRKAVELNREAIVARHQLSFLSDAAPARTASPPRPI